MGQLTLVEVRALYQQWQRTPPLPEAIAAVLRGFKALPDIDEDEDAAAWARLDQPDLPPPPPRVYSRAEVIEQFMAAGFLPG